MFKKWPVLGLRVHCSEDFLIVALVYKEGMKNLLEENRLYVNE
jgi:hypothetical protein